MKRAFAAQPAAASRSRTVRVAALKGARRAWRGRQSAVAPRRGAIRASFGDRAGAGLTAPPMWGADHPARPPAGENVQQLAATFAAAALLHAAPATAGVILEQPALKKVRVEQRLAGEGGQWAAPVSGQQLIDARAGQGPGPAIAGLAGQGGQAGRVKVP